jgi:hypothetical protein
VLEEGQVIHSLAEVVDTAGAGMTHGMYAIYDADMNLVAETADTPTAFEVSNAWATLPLTTPYTVPSTGLYYLVDLLAGTTMPTIANVGSSTATARTQLPNGVFRGIHAGSGLTDFPATLSAGTTGVTRCIVAY